jgi:phosphomannomutase
MDAKQLREKVKLWIAQDPDPLTRQELESLLTQGADDELSERFSGTLEFGTAGLRGTLGGGPMRMNRAVVRRASAGLAAYLKTTVKDAATRGVVIGYDGRRMSREFAEEAASAVAGAGMVVHLFDNLCPTPMVAYGVLQTNAAAGVMVTASHNPPEYNGYKVYWENGAQIIPPHDKGISKAIDEVGPLQTLPMPPVEKARRKGLVRSLGAELESRYLAEVRKLVLHPEAPRDLEIVSTPLHGVGGTLAKAALGQAGFTRVAPVEAQFEPVGRFPTVRFPNPEEKGALDLAFALARERRADLIIANDPDADRLSVAVPTGTGDYLQLSGDQVGALLAYYLLTEKAGGAERAVVTTIVSSSLLSRMAEGLGLRYAEVLTGFKWIANRALALEAEGAEFVMGYEEALGYTLGRIVRDKDGISAAAVFAELAAFCKSEGKTVLGYLEEIYRRFGLFQSGQHNVVLPGSAGAAQIQEIMKRLRASPPKAVGTAPVNAVRDLLNGIRRSAEGEQAIDLPRSDVLVFELPDARITCRPSGTEPKIKYYFELREQIAAGEPFPQAKARAEEKMKVLIAQFLEAIKPA